MYGPPLDCKRKMKSHGQVCANVYGLGWSEAHRARMECAAPCSHLVGQSWKTSSGFGFGARRVRPVCHLRIRQQTGEEVACYLQALASVCLEAARHPELFGVLLRVLQLAPQTICELLLSNAQDTT